MRMTTSALMALVCIGRWAFTARSRWSLFAGFSNKNGATLAFRTFMAPLLMQQEIS